MILQVFGLHGATAMLEKGMVLKELFGLGLRRTLISSWLLIGDTIGTLSDESITNKRYVINCGGSIENKNKVCKPS